MRFVLTLSTALVVMLTSLPSEACTIIAVGKDASADGSVLISQTDSGQDTRIYVVHGRKFEPGSKAPVYFGIQDATLELEDDGDILGYIPQAEETYTYFHTAYSHINEHQLAIAESTTDQREELKVTRETGGQIMTIEQAMIFALQPAEIGGPVEAGGLWHLATVQDVRDAQYSDLEDPATRKHVRRKYIHEKLTYYVVELTKNESPIEVYEHVLMRLAQQEADMVKTLSAQSQDPDSVTQQRIKEMQKLLNP